MRGGDLRDERGSLFELLARVPLDHPLRPPIQKIVDGPWCTDGGIREAVASSYGRRFP